MKIFSFMPFLYVWEHNLSKPRNEKFLLNLSVLFINKNKKEHPRTPHMSFKMFKWSHSAEKYYGLGGGGSSFPKTRDLEKRKTGQYRKFYWFLWWIQKGNGQHIFWKEVVCCLNMIPMCIFLHLSCFFMFAKVISWEAWNRKSSPTCKCFLRTKTKKNTPGPHTCDIIYLNKDDILKNTIS